MCVCVCLEEYKLPGGVGKVEWKSPSCCQIFLAREVRGSFKWGGWGVSLIFFSSLV